MNATLSKEPLPQLSMDASTIWKADEKRVQTVDGGAGCEHRHQHKCSRRKLRIGIMISIASILLGILTFVFLNVLEATGDNLVGGFWKRALGDGTSGTANESPFTKNKLYIIVIVLGLLFCLIAAIMLSAWCCRGAFENPLCCPCYLCACCGGLACLQCISCGLCVELADQA